MDAHAVTPSPWMILPFGLLLGLTALAPLWCGGWWQRWYPAVAAVLGAVAVGYYGLGLHAPGRVLETAREYFSFIVLIGSLFVVSGGIHITVQGEATPRVNVLFLLLGAVLANVFGTTGASMLLIRPWLRMNRYRVTAHHVVFFIFLVSNVGGCLTPIGDPPLFLGYLRGVPFGWVLQHCWPAWLTAVSILLFLFYLIDARNYRRAPIEVRERLAEPPDQWRFQGLPNLGFLAVIVGAVFITRPPGLREGVMIAAAVGSYLTTPRRVHESNEFHFHPLREVAILFAGIFATMMPALDWLYLHAASLGASTPSFYYWSAGTLSSVLDNAPTYLSFLSTALGAFAGPDVVASVQGYLAAHGGDLTTLAGVSVTDPVFPILDSLRTLHGTRVDPGTLGTADIQMAQLLGDPAASRCLVAISVGAVFFGANTYIGNGPNFMVKAIADHQNVHTPGFLAYVACYTLPIMLPVLTVVWVLFIR